MSYYIPQWEERTSYGFRRIDPYAKLFEDRIIFLGTPISDDVSSTPPPRRVPSVAGRAPDPRHPRGCPRTSATRPTPRCRQPWSWSPVWAVGDPGR